MAAATQQPGREDRPTEAPIVLYTLPSLKIGGAELRSLELVRALKSRHAKLHLVLYVFSPESGPLGPAFEGLGVRIVHGRRGLAGVAHLWRTSAKLRPSILHTNADLLCGFHCFAAALAGVPRRIAHYRSAAVPGASLRERVILHVGRWLLRGFATDVVGVCESSRAVAGVSARRWQTVYDGTVRAAPDAGESTRDGARSLLFVGRIHPEKGYLKAVDVFDQLRSETAGETRLHFLGTGTAAEMARLRDRVDRSPHRASIVLHGQVDDVRAHLRSGDALLLPSVRDALPGAVLEALSEGMPVVASDLPGLREIQAVTDGVCLVPRSAPLAAWGDRAAAALTQGRSEAIRSAFERSPFLFEPFVEAIERLWRLKAERMPHDR